ncbi:MAG TPA: hypothetical protein VK859_00560 [bacterium]|nr:hypothetical protein [bacterium]
MATAFDSGLGTGNGLQGAGMDSFFFGPFDIVCLVFECFQLESGRENAIFRSRVLGLVDERGGRDSFLFDFLRIIGIHNPLVFHGTGNVSP